MSVPHTGNLVALVKGVRCHFDGNRWKTPEAALTALLQDTTDCTPKTHISIRELAELVLRLTELTKDAQIISVKHDSWPEKLPDEAED